MAGSPLKQMFPFGACQAHTTKGKRCGCRQVFKMKNGRLICKWHGGLSTGPKTEEGKKRSPEAQALRDAGRARYWDDIRAGRRTLPQHSTNGPRALERVRARIKYLQQRIETTE